MGNRRTKRTDAEIKQAFTELLSKKKIEKIRIREICELAQVSRATFYLHFEDIYAVYESINNDILDELKSIFQNASGKNAEELLINRTELSIDYIDQNMELIKFMAMNGNLIDKVITAWGSFFLKEFYPNEQTLYGIVEIDFVVWGLVGTLNDWVDGKLQISKEDFTRIIKHVLGRFIE